MSVFRKENGSLVKKAGRALVDLAFSLTSNSAIANSAVSEGMALRNVTLYNGKLYQLNLDGTRGDEIEMGGVKRIFRGKKTLSADVTTLPAKVSITLPNTVDPSKCHVTLYGNGATPSAYEVNVGMYVDSLTSTTLTVGVANSNLGLHGKSIIGYEIVEYN